MIKLTKIDINPNSGAIQASTIEEYRTDQERGTWGQWFEGKSPPVDYWIVGELIGEIQVGKAILIDRWNRNGVVIRGIMHTSEVMKLEENDGVTYITTANSLYKMEQVDEEDVLNYEMGLFKN
jgi:hypothetical protein